MPFSRILQVNCCLLPHHAFPPELFIYAYFFLEVASFMHGTATKYQGFEFVGVDDRTVSKGGTVSIYLSEY